MTSLITNNADSRQRVVDKDVYNAGNRDCYVFTPPSATVVDSASSDATVPFTKRTVFHHSYGEVVKFDFTDADTTDLGPTLPPGVWLIYVRAKVTTGATTTGQLELNTTVSGTTTTLHISETIQASATSRYVEMKYVYDVATNVRPKIEVLLNKLSGANACQIASGDALSSQLVLVRLAEHRVVVL
jgi:hypothetical protein